MKQNWIRILLVMLVLTAGLLLVACDDDETIELPAPGELPGSEELDDLGDEPVELPTLQATPDPGLDD